MVGEDQHQIFVEERFIKCDKPGIHDISKNKLPLFNHKSAKYPSKHKMQVAALKKNCNLFSRLYLSCQTRTGHLDMFLAHENHAAPPSLSIGGKLRLATKAEKRSLNTSIVDATVLDGAAVVQMLNPGVAKTFQEYADMVILPYVSNQLTTAKRVDVVWDMYIQVSLKDTTRQKRGTGIRRRVAPSPRNGKIFFKLMRIKLSCSNFWHNSWCNFLLVKEKLFMQLMELMCYVP